MKELVDIQNELKAPKNQVNKFGGYNYRSAEDILEAAKKVLVKHGCYLTITDGIEMIGDRVYIVATATVTNSEGKSVSTKAYAREEETKKGMDAAQITGSASSYARKYALNGLFCIDDTKDPDATNTHGKDEPKLTMEMAKADIAKCTDSNGLNTTWKKYQNTDFKKDVFDALTARKKELGLK